MRARIWRGLALVAFSLACITGCGLAPAIATLNVPAAEVSVTITVHITDDIQTGAPSTEIIIQLRQAITDKHARAGTIIQGANSHALICNGAELAFHQTATPGIQADSYSVGLRDTNAFHCVYTALDSATQTLVSTAFDFVAEAPQETIALAPNSAIRIPRPGETATFTLAPAVSTRLSNSAVITDFNGAATELPNAASATTLTLSGDDAQSVAIGRGTLGIRTAQTNAFVTNNGFFAVRIDLIDRLDQVPVIWF
jgi:hypothetical protein